jgi:hypothetical protein
MALSWQPEVRSDRRLILRVADCRALSAMPALAMTNAPFFQMYSDNTQDPLSSDSAQLLPIHAPNIFQEMAPKKPTRQCGGKNAGAGGDGGGKKGPTASTAAGAAAAKAGASGGKRGPGQGAANETGAGGGKNGPATRQDTAAKAGAGGGKNGPATRQDTCCAVC